MSDEPTLARSFPQRSYPRDAAVTALWSLAKGPCEKITGQKLRVARQYANGHTYGQGGQSHVDDERAGTFTLLYYPMPQWRAEWEGETLFYDGRGEVIGGVRESDCAALLRGFFAGRR